MHLRRSGCGVNPGIMVKYGLRVSRISPPAGSDRCPRKIPVIRFRRKSGRAAVSGTRAWQRLGRLSRSSDAYFIGLPFLIRPVLRCPRARRSSSGAAREPAEPAQCAFELDRLGREGICLNRSPQGARPCRPHNLMGVKSPRALPPYQYLRESASSGQRNLALAERHAA